MAYKAQKDGKKLIEIYWFRPYVCRGHVSSGARCTGWDKSLLSEYIQLKRHRQHVVEVNSVSYWRKTVVKNRVLVKSFFLNPTISVSSNNFLLVKICCVVPAGDFILSINAISVYLFKKICDRNFRKKTTRQLVSQIVEGDKTKSFSK